jgi:hypothetical protein
MILSRLINVTDTRDPLGFLVNGTGIPEVDFDVGESYAGLLPNTPAGNSSLFFWFFPSQNPKADDEVSVVFRLD